MNIVSNTLLCPGEYVIPDGINFGASGVTIRCDNTVLIGTQSAIGVEVNGHDNVKIKDCELRNYSIGIRLLNSMNSDVESNKLLGNMEGVRVEQMSPIQLFGKALEATEGNRINKNRFRDNIQRGLYVGQSPSNNITGNTLSSTHNTTVSVILHFSDSNFISGNEMENGLQISGGTQNTLQDNKISFAAGESVVKVSDGANNNQFIENEIFDSAVNGFSIETNGNVFLDNYVHSIPRGFFFNSNSGNQLIGGTIEDAVTGVYFMGSSSSSVSGVNASSNVLNSVHLNQSSNIVVYNSIVSNVLLEHSTYNLIDNNFCTVANSAISLENSSLNNISFNRNRCSMILENSTENILMFNTETGNFFGILLLSSSENFIYHNLISDSEWGIMILNSSNNTIKNNVVDYNGYGIYLENSDLHTIEQNEVCFNNETDFLLNNSANNWGDDNRCDNPDGWNDDGTTGCMFACGNNPPVLEPISDKIVKEMWGTVRIRPIASDPNNDTLEYNINSLLFAWDGTFFTWRPGPVDSGEYDFLVNVTDGTFWDEEPVHVTVEDTCTTYNKYERCWVGCNCPVERDENKDIGFEGDALGSGEIQ